MKSALIALQHSMRKGPELSGFCTMIQRFQDKGLLTLASVTALDGHDDHAIPLAWYEESKADLGREALNETREAVAGRFQYRSLDVFDVKAADPAELVKDLSQLARKKQADLLVFPVEDKDGLEAWLPDSLAKVLAVDERLPVLLIKNTSEASLSPALRWIVGVDVSAPCPRTALHWLADAAREAEAEIDLVYVQPQPRPLRDSLLHRETITDPEATLKTLQIELIERGVQVNVSVVPEESSIAATLVRYAEQKKAWLNVTLSLKRGWGERLLMGSNAQDVLALTRRPFLSLQPQA